MLENLEKNSKKSPYHKLNQAMIRGLKKIFRTQLVLTQLLLQNVLKKIILSKNPKKRYLVGYGARLMLFVRSFSATEFSNYF